MEKAYSIRKWIIVICIFLRTINTYCFPVMLKMLNVLVKLNNLRNFVKIIISFQTTFDSQIGNFLPLVHVMSIEIFCGFPNFGRFDGLYTVRILSEKM